jgi:hypothetical protein
MLLPEEIIQTVLMPFLVAPSNIKERIEIREMEDSLIAKGKMKEEDKIVFENDSKMIALSSASYTFENLFHTYKEWMGNIYSSKIGTASYFISQMGYESLPKEMIDKTIIDEAQNGGQSHSSFLREYCAQFTDGSDSYFSAKKMHECTIPDGEEPTTLIKGKTGAKYILAIDPSFSNSPSSDYFAMAVMELDEDKEEAILVHGYAVAGGNLKDHIKYLSYLFANFDIVMTVIDNAGYQFLDSANEHKLFIDSRINLKFLDFESEKEGVDYDKQLVKLKRQYNKENHKICFKQNFSTDFIRKSNEHLQACIDHKKIWFASRTTANGSVFNRQSSCHINLKLVNEPNIGEFIEIQDSLVHQVKKQCALIEVRTTPRGSQTFDLPHHLKRSTSANRARKDNYTALMLATWGVRCYFDMLNQKTDINSTFSPRMIG